VQPLTSARKVVKTFKPDWPRKQHLRLDWLKYLSFQSPVLWKLRRFFPALGTGRLILLPVLIGSFRSFCFVVIGFGLVAVD